MRARVALSREGILTAAAIFSLSRELRFRGRAHAEYGMHIDYIELRSSEILRTYLRKHIRWASPFRCSDSKAY